MMTMMKKVNYEEVNLVLNTSIMVTTVDDDGNTIGNEDQAGDFTNETDHDSSCISDVIGISNILSDYNCVGFSDSRDSTSSSDRDFDEGSSISYSSFC